MFGKMVWDGYGTGFTLLASAYLRKLTIGLALVIVVLGLPKGQGTE